MVDAAPTPGGQPHESAAPIPHVSLPPSRRDRLRPLELLGFSAVLAIFSALVVMFVLRTSDGGVDLVRAGIVAAVVFIVCLVTLALIGLGGAPSEQDIEARKDLQQHPHARADGAEQGDPTDLKGD